MENYDKLLRRIEYVKYMLESLEQFAESGITDRQLVDFEESVIKPLVVFTGRFDGLSVKEALAMAKQDLEELNENVGGQ